jgi:phosphoserine phosphatase
VRKVAIYDLDGTVLRRDANNRNGVNVARRHEPWRLCLAPVWFVAMALYKLGAFSRRSLKQFGLRLFLGRRMRLARLEAISREFADYAAAHWVAPGAARAMADDRAEGATLIMATAAMEFYAGEIAQRLGFDHVIATGNQPLASDPSACRLAGENCYGAEKPVRVTALFEKLGWKRDECTVRFYTDSVSDAPLLDWADVAVFVNGGAGANRIAAQRGWLTARF